MCSLCFGNCRALLLWYCLLRSAGRAAFEPSFHDAQVAVLSVVEGAVYATLGLPKISPATISNSTLLAPPAVTNAAALANNPTVIPGTALSEEVVQGTVKVTDAKPWQTQKLCSAGELTQQQHAV